jgi:hypothetical protein
MTRKKPPKDDVEVMRELARETLWRIDYHETRLIMAHKIVSYVKAMLVRGNYEFSFTEACNDADEDDYDYNSSSVNARSADQWIKCIVSESAAAVTHHEKELTGAMAALGAIKVALKRGNYHEIDLGEIAKKIQADNRAREQREEESD